MKRPRDQAGSATLELAVLTPAVIALLGAVVLAGHVESAKARVAQAAEDAARAATMARDQTSAQTDAESAAAADLAGPDCSSWTLSVVGTLVPGTSMSATITCTTGLGILPGSFHVANTASAAVDRYRGVG